MRLVGAPVWAFVLAVLLLTACTDETTFPLGDGAGLADAGTDLSIDAPSDAVADPDAADEGVADADAAADAAFDVAADLFDEPDASDLFDEPDLADAGDRDDVEVMESDCSVAGVAGECLDVSACTGDRSPTPGFCPGPANIQCCTPNDGEACDPDAMPTPNAGLTERAGVEGCPSGMVPVADFCIDQYEASLLEVLDGGGTRSWSPYHNPGTRRMRAVSLAGAVPQGYITGDQAADACAEAGKRLCTNEEWLRACHGAGMTNTYPYGPEQVVGWCNENREPHPVIEYFGTTADWIWSQLGNACINQLPDSLAETGEYQECVSAESVYDLVGNLHEWTADPNGTFRGGYYVDTWRNFEGCNYRTTAHNRLHWDYSTGFRCCSNP